jgi:hypothetical protein
MSKMGIEQRERRGPILFFGGALVGLYILYILVTVAEHF